MVSIGAIVCVWYLFPSIGPSAWASVAPDAQDRIGLVFNAEAGAALRRLAAEGVEEISPDRIMGVIAFPSFHIVMACMVVWFTRATLAFVPAIAINLAMVPATLAHGGHHLIDVLAGLVLFVLCVAVVNRALPGPEPERPRAG